MRAIIAPNLIKISVDAYLLNGYLIYFKILILRRWKKCNVLGLGLTKFDQGLLNGSQSPKNLHMGLSLKWEPKYSFKFQFRESEKKVYFLEMGT